MSLAKAVEEQGKLADELHKENFPEQYQKTEPAPEAGIPVQTQEPALPPAPTKTEEDSFKVKYQVLQGKYNAEVPRLIAEVKSLKTTLQESNTKVQELIATKPAPQPSEATAKSIQALTEEHGESFVSNLRNLFLTELEHAKGELVGEINKVKDFTKGVESSSKKTREDSFFERLVEAVPDWESMNIDPEFLSWLGTKEKFSGMTYQDALNVAYADLDSRKVIGLFKAYETEKKPSSRTNELDVHITPGTQTQAPTTQKTQINLLTQMDIQSFYNDVREGKYRGRDDDFKRKEAEIFAAYSEGRIAP